MWRGSWLSLLLSMSVCGVVCSSGGGGGGGGDTGNGGSGSADFPLRLAPDGRRLEDTRGRPFLLQGDAAWSLMVALTTAEMESYLDDRRQRGFNTVLVNLIERGFGGPANAAATGIADFAAPGRRFLVLDDAAANLPRPGS